ncbi:unnamed protein product, partial [Laminaria digitata]
ACVAIVFSVLVAACAPNGTNSTARGVPALSEGEIDSTIERLMAANDVKGLAVVLIEAGGVTFAKGYGHRMVEKGLPLEPDTIIYGASLTKATFAYFVMQLVDEGLVELDKPIADYLPRPLPDYENYRDLVGDARWRVLTLRMLLSHTPGFANFRWFDPAG